MGGYDRLRIRRLGVRLPFDLYELDMRVKREFGAKSPPIPRPKRKPKMGPIKFLVVPIVVPASTQNHPSSTPRQPTRQEKTP